MTEEKKNCVLELRKIECNENEENLIFKLY